MQADHGVALARAAEILVELGQHFDRQVAAGLVGHDAVEQHDAPGADIGGAVQFERPARERRAHLRHEVMIAGDAKYRLAEAREQAAEVFVATRVVLHQIAGHQDGVTNGKMARRVRQGCARAFRTD